MNLRLKACLGAVLCVVIPVTAVGILCYVSAHSFIFRLTEEKLAMQVAAYRQELELTHVKILADEAEARERARQIVGQQAGLIHRLATEWARDEESLKDVLAEIPVGRTGYVYALNYEGHYVVSKGRAADGKDISQVRDAEGRLFVQDIIEKGQGLKGDAVDFDVYPWLNSSETVARDKIAALIHLPERQWVVGVSAYFDDLVRQGQLEEMKASFFAKLKGEQVGETGYMYVMDSEGILLAHPTSEGQNVSTHDFSRHILNQKEGILEYDWEGRSKVVAFTYFEPLDWIIVSGSYTKEFAAAATDMLVTIFLVGFLAMALVTGLTVVITARIVGRIEATSKSLDAASLQIDTASKQVAESAQAMASGATQQSASIGGASSSLMQVSDTVHSNTGGITSANQLAGQSRESAQAGAEAVDRLMTAIEEIRDSANKTASIIKTIDEIAFQTNLLALNAAVEAARAGDAGKGFAVVAEEVRSLASRSADAARTTSDLLMEAQAKAANGAQVTAEVQDRLASIKESTENVAGILKNIATASKEQSAGLGLITSSVSEVDKVTQTNAASSEQCAAASEELAAQAVDLKAMVQDLVAIVDGVAKTDDSDLSEAYHLRS